MKKINLKQEDGFTLVEMLVSIAIFVVLVTVSLGAIASIFDANRKSQSLKAVMTNLNFAVEVMAREMRFGTNYHCGSTGNLSQPQNCSSGDSSISFLSSDGRQIVYSLDSVTHQLQKSEDGGGNFLGITAPEITIQSLKFFVVGAGAVPLNYTQPKVLILLRGYAGSKVSSQSVFTVETTVSQRILDTQ